MTQSELSLVARAVVEVDSLLQMAWDSGAHGLRVSTLHSSGKTFRTGPGSSTSIGGGCIVIFISGPWEMHGESWPRIPYTSVQVLAHAVRALTSHFSPLAMAAVVVHGL